MNRYSSIKDKIMTPNLVTLALVSLIPFAFAYLWFHPNVFGGSKWYSMAELPDEKRGKVAISRLLLTLLLNFLLAFGLSQLALHQMGVFSLVGGDIELLRKGIGAQFLNAYGNRHLSFGHGVFHGVMAAILFGAPFLGYVCIFEKKSLKYFLVYLGYWIISFALMGGVICLYGGVPA